MRNIDKARLLECSTMKGNHSKHHVCSLLAKDPTLYQYQQLSYFCVYYINGRVKGGCVNKEHDLEWTLIRLRPKNNLKVRGMMYDLDEEIEVGTKGEWIAKNLFLSDNVVVPTLVDEPFWLMLVDKNPHVVVVSFKDAIGNEWMEGDVVVCGFLSQPHFGQV
jgi:hypothetical protein